MPNIWTHLIFGREVLKKTGHSHLIQSAADANIFHLGCQGPDFLFYHNFLPWKKDKRLSELGSRIHHEQCGPFLLAMVEYARSQLQAQSQKGHSTDQDGQEAAMLAKPLALYVLGFILHHVLDRNMHPYIYYKSGFKKWDHQRFEVILDTLMARSFMGVETWKTPVWKQIYTGDSFPDGVEELFQHVSAKVFPDTVGSIQKQEWTEAYRDMITAQKLFHDPTGIKRLLTAFQIEPMVYKRENAPLDYLNEAKQIWNHPVSQTETSNASVWELWEQALLDAIAVFTQVANLLTEENEPDAETRARLADVIGDVSYDTGKPWKLGLEIKFVNPIL